MSLTNRPKRHRIIRVREALTAKGRLQDKSAEYD